MNKLKPYPKYKPVKLNFANKIPYNWLLLRGKFIFKEINERSINGKEQLLSVSEHRGVVPRNSINVNMFKAEDYAGYKLCIPGDVVINSLWAWHRGIGIAEHRGIVSTAYSIHRLKRFEEWNYKFLSYLLRTNAYVGEYLIRSKGIWESRLQLTGSNFQDIPILVPSLAEQNAIVAYLDAKTQQIQDFITKKQKLIQLLEEKKTAVIHRLITQGIQKNKELVETEIKWFDKIPKHWELKKLKFVVSKVKTGTTPSSRKDYFDKEEFNWFTPSDFNNQFELISSSKKINFNAVKDGEVSVFPKDSVLMIGIGGTLGKVGIIKENSSSNQQINSITFNTQLLPEYGLYLLDFIGKELLNILDYTTLPILNQLETKRLPFLKPPLQEQKEIVDIIKKISDEITQAITQAQKEIEKLQEYQESLISHLVTGQLQVPVT